MTPAPVRLADLPPAGRRIILALIAAARAAKEEPTAIEQPAGSKSGGTRDANRQI